MIWERIEMYSGLLVHPEHRRRCISRPMKRRCSFLDRLRCERKPQSRQRAGAKEIDVAAHFDGDL